MNCYSSNELFLLIIILFIRLLKNEELVFLSVILVLTIKNYNPLKIHRLLLRMPFRRLFRFRDRLPLRHIPIRVLHIHTFSSFPRCTSFCSSLFIFILSAQNPPLRVYTTDIRSLRVILLLRTRIRIFYIRNLSFLRFSASV